MSLSNARKLLQRKRRDFPEGTAVRYWPARRGGAGLAAAIVGWRLDKWGANVLAEVAGFNHSVWPGSIQRLSPRSLIDLREFLDEVCQVQKGASPCWS